MESDRQEAEASERKKMRLEREQYVGQWRESRWSGLIKVVTGVRRCGKT